MKLLTNFVSRLPLAVIQQCFAHFDSFGLIQV